MPLKKLSLSVLAAVPLIVGACPDDDAPPSAEGRGSGTETGSTGPGATTMTTAPPTTDSPETTGGSRETDSLGGTADDDDDTSTTAGGAMTSTGVGAASSTGDPGGSTTGDAGGSTTGAVSTGTTGELGDCCMLHPSPGCENEVCEAAVCGKSSYCCSIAWDIICASQAAELPECACTDGTTGDTGGPVELASNCCVPVEPNGEPGCEDPVCEAAICAIDPFCCADEWISLCALEAIDTTECACHGINPDQD